MGVQGKETRNTCKGRGDGLSPWCVILRMYACVCECGAWRWWARRQTLVITPRTILTFFSQVASDPAKYEPLIQIPERPWRVVRNSCWVGALVTSLPSTGLTTLTSSHMAVEALAIYVSSRRTLYVCESFVSSILNTPARCSASVPAERRPGTLGRGLGGRRKGGTHPSGRGSASCSCRKA